MQLYFDRYYFEPLTLVYLIKNDQVLLLRRNSTKAVLPNMLLGVGGKVEIGESIIDGAKREVEEESGYELRALYNKGVFVFIDQKNEIAGMVHLFISKDFTGQEQSDNREGVLEWHPISTLPELNDLATHQLHFLPKILTENNFKYCKTHVYTSDGSIEIFDEVPEFDLEQKRKA